MKRTAISGLTLIELMVVVTIIGIMATIAIPSFRTMLANDRTSAVANDLLASIQQARSEAVKLSRNSIVCPRNVSNVESCGSSWTDGWVIRINQTPTPSNVMTTARVRDNLPPNISITSNVSGTPPMLQFRPLGQVHPADTFTFTITHANPAATRVVCVFAGGQSRISSTQSCP